VMPKQEEYPIGNVCPVLDRWGSLRTHVPLQCYGDVSKKMEQLSSTISVWMKVCQNCGGVYAETFDQGRETMDL